MKHGFTEQRDLLHNISCNHSNSIQLTLIKKINQPNQIIPNRSTTYWTELITFHKRTY